MFTKVWYQFADNARENPIVHTVVTVTGQGSMLYYVP